MPLSSCRELNTNTACWPLVARPQEYCDRGTLSSLVGKVPMDPADDLQMLRLLLLLQDAARGLQALHSKSVVHGDLVSAWSGGAGHVHTALAC